MSDNDGHKIVLKGIPWDVSKDKIKVFLNPLLKKYDIVSGCQRVSGRQPDGSLFITYQTFEQAELAMQRLDGKLEFCDGWTCNLRSHLPTGRESISAGTMITAQQMHAPQFQPVRRMPMQQMARPLQPVMMAGQRPMIARPVQQAAGRFMAMPSMINQQQRPMMGQQQQFRPQQISTTNFGQARVMMQAGVRPANVQIRGIAPVQGVQRAMMPTRGVQQVQNMQRAVPVANRAMPVAMQQPQQQPTFARAAVQPRMMPGQAIPVNHQLTRPGGVQVVQTRQMATPKPMQLQQQTPSPPPQQQQRPSPAPSTSSYAQPHPKNSQKRQDDEDSRSERSRSWSRSRSRSRSRSTPKKHKKRDNNDGSSTSSYKPAPSAMIPRQNMHGAGTRPGLNLRAPNLSNVPGMNMGVKGQQKGKGPPQLNKLRSVHQGHQDETQSHEKKKVVDNDLYGIRGGDEQQDGRGRGHDRDSSARYRDDSHSPEAPSGSRRNSILNNPPNGMSPVLTSALKLTRQRSNDEISQPGRNWQDRNERWDSATASTSWGDSWADESTPPKTPEGYYNRGRQWDNYRDDSKWNDYRDRNSDDYRDRHSEYQDGRKRWGRYLSGVSNDSTEHKPEHSQDEPTQKKKLIMPMAKSMPGVRSASAHVPKGLVMPKMGAGLAGLKKVGTAQNRAGSAPLLRPGIRLPTGPGLPGRAPMLPGQRAPPMPGVRPLSRAPGAKSNRAPAGGGLTRAPVAGVGGGGGLGGGLGGGRGMGTQPAQMTAANVGNLFSTSTEPVKKPEEKQPEKEESTQDDELDEYGGVATTGVLIEDDDDEMPVSRQKRRRIIEDSEEDVVPTTAKEKPKVKAKAKKQPSRPLAGFAPRVQKKQHKEHIDIDPLSELISYMDIKDDQREIPRGGKVRIQLSKEQYIPPEPLPEGQTTFIDLPMYKSKKKPAQNNTAIPLPFNEVNPFLNEPAHFTSVWDRIIHEQARKNTKPKLPIDEDASPSAIKQTELNNEHITWNQPNHFEIECIRDAHAQIHGSHAVIINIRAMFIDPHAKRPINTNDFGAVFDQQKKTGPSFERWVEYLEASLSREIDYYRGNLAEGVFLNEDITIREAEFILSDNLIGDNLSPFIDWLEKRNISPRFLSLANTNLSDDSLKLLSNHLDDLVVQDKIHIDLSNNDAITSDGIKNLLSCLFGTNISLKFSNDMVERLRIAELVNESGKNIVVLEDILPMDDQRPSVVIEQGIAVS